MKTVQTQESIHNCTLIHSSLFNLTHEELRVFNKHLICCSQDISSNIYVHVIWTLQCSKKQAYLKVLLKGCKYYPITLRRNQYLCFYHTFNLYNKYYVWGFGGLGLFCLFLKGIFLFSSSKTSRIRCKTTCCTNDPNIPNPFLRSGIAIVLLVKALLLLFCVSTACYSSLLG